MIEMDNERKGKNIVIAVLLVSVLCLSVAFAANIGTNLKVNGTVNIVTPNWDVAFVDPVTNVTKPADAEAPVVSNNGTVITYTVELEAGESYAFTATVKNSGTFDAKLNNYTAATIPTWLVPYVEYSETGLTTNDIIKVGATKDLAVSFKIKDITDADTLKAFQDAIAANESSITLNIQADFIPAE